MLGLDFWKMEACHVRWWGEKGKGRRGEGFGCVSFRGRGRWLVNYFEF
jgi:hypothetical protein